MKSAKSAPATPAWTPHVPDPHGVASSPPGLKMNPGTPPHAQGDLSMACGKGRCRMSGRSGGVGIGIQARVSLNSEDGMHGAYMGGLWVGCVRD
eukprot:scaffold18546_cov100-Isochrysis_galbana.AAC.1